ncbi:hypothetical protein Q8A67_003954 [Cirrhinus molitorella]|uniref:Immunoglobulin V-set domain-containing protein n=1 Tax=Cirrhinus molitorella TaxID=172907 RepID=A0AA88TWT2_9TELE|nr:hypothetical protein Q8A67_003954 [Cirrhinus molitorella]
MTNVKLSIELQSDVLLPCFFKSDLLNSNQTNETCVVWTHLNSTYKNIVEISLDGETKFWNNQGGRIRKFPKLPESELLDFSIQIRNVQQSDLGIYHCNLFRQTCLLAYKRIELHNGQTVDEVTYASVIHRPHNSSDSSDLVRDNLISGSTEVSGHGSSVLYAAIKERT